MRQVFRNFLCRFLVGHNWDIYMFPMGSLFPTYLGQCMTVKCRRCGLTHPLFIHKEKA